MGGWSYGVRGKSSTQKNTNIYTVSLLFVCEKRDTVKIKIKSTLTEKKKKKKALYSRGRGRGRGVGGEVS
jgi:hypothetical protein